MEEYLVKKMSISGREEVMCVKRMDWNDARDEQQG